MSDLFPHLGLRLAYDGKNFSGFQLQPDGRSIQEILEKALSTVLKRSVRILFSSRTDSGVHAFDQWAMVANGIKDYENLSSKSQDAFLISVNALLPASVRVWRVFKLHKNFHPQKSVRAKEYRYRVLMGSVCDPSQRDFALWIRRSLDLSEMKKAFKKFEGLHDFRAFAKKVQRYEEKTKRRVLSARIDVKAHPAILDVKEIQFVVVGEGFLHHMVRTMVGTVLEIGKGESHDIAALLKSGHRRDAGVNAPPQGLFLWRTRVKSSLARPLGRRVKAD